MEDSSDESAEWSGEEKEESAEKEEAAISGGAGEAIRPLTATAGKS